jgi:hypothetical protein
LLALEERFAVGELVDLHPAAHLVAEGIEFGGTPWSGFGRRRAMCIFAHRVARQTSLPRDGPLGLALQNHLLYGMHEAAPDHRRSFREVKFYEKNG